jgi:hypothetical protein
MTDGARVALISLSAVCTFLCLSYAVVFDDVRREAAFALSGAGAVWSALMVLVFSPGEEA